MNLRPSSLVSNISAAIQYNLNYKLTVEHYSNLYSLYITDNALIIYKYYRQTEFDIFTITRFKTELFTPSEGEHYLRRNYSENCR